MNHKGFTNIVVIAVISIFAGVSAHFVFVKNSRSNLIEIQYEDLNKFVSEKSFACISAYNTTSKEPKEFVINTEIEYQNLPRVSSQCTNFVLSSIDFSQKTLLGKYASGGGCSIDFVKKVHRDTSNKKIIYTIDVVEQGGCMMFGFSRNWILIPKVPSDYSVEFKMK